MTVTQDSLLCVAVIWFLEDLLSDYYEIEVKYAASQLKMKILGDGKGYSLTEFCEEADGYVLLQKCGIKSPTAYQLLTSMTS